MRRAPFSNHEIFRSPEKGVLTKAGVLNLLLRIPIYNQAYPVFWMSSGSCPLCLTPPCYDFGPPQGGSFFGEFDRRH